MSIMYKGNDASEMIDLEQGHGYHQAVIFLIWYNLLSDIRSYLKHTHTFKLLWKRVKKIIRKVRMSFVVSYHNQSKMSIN